MKIESMLSTARIDAMAAAGLWSNRLVCDYLDEAAAANPAAVAIVDNNSLTQSSTRLTYAQLHEYSVRIACALVELGVEPGDVVGVQLPNWWHYAVIYCACARIGAVINPLMPIFRERELEFMLGLTEARVLIVPREFRGFDYPSMASNLRARLAHIEHVFVVDGAEQETSFEHVLLERRWEDEVDVVSLFRERRPSPNDVTEIMYTSGTTGEPKGVMHTANTLLCKGQLASELFSFGSDDVIFMGSPLAHQTGFMYAVVLSIYQGCKCVLQDVWDPLAAARLIEQERCTITLGSTPFLSDLVRHPDVPTLDTKSLRLFLCAGAPIPRVLIREAQSVLPDMYVMSAWGMTEMGIATATYPGDAADKVINTDGRGLPQQQVRVVGDDGVEVATGTEGRLQSRCATTFVGYFNRPEAYEVDDEFWLETGDNARMDSDGYIRITGRSKDIIIRGGENIPVVEVEELLYRHAAIQDAAVVAMPDERLGERGCAFVSLIDGERFDFQSMIDYLVEGGLIKQYLPEHLEILAAFPRTPSGKIQKFKLREMATQFKPTQAAK